MAIHLSKERYDSTPHGALISWGVIENSPDGVYMTSEHGVFPLLWTAWKGHGPDWAIYVMNFETLIANENLFMTQYCHDYWDKVHWKDLIARMIDADPEVLEMYRQ